MGFFSAKSLAGPGYIILNILRAFNIVTLLAVAAAAIVLLPKIHMTSNFWFFEAVSHVITFFVAAFLIVSETSLFQAYFARNFPLLSPIHSFNTLGLLMLALGIETLGNLNQDADSSSSLGLGFWRIIIGSGILAFIFGIINIVVSFVFRDKALGVTARQIRGKGAVALTSRPPQNPWDRIPGGNSNAGSFYTATASSAASKIPEKDTKVPWRQRFSKFKPSAILPTYNEKASGARPTISRPIKSSSQESLVDMREAASHPMAGNPYDQRDHGDGRRPPPAPSSYYSDHEEHLERQRSMQISGPLNINHNFAHLVPQFAKMQRPDSTYHPSRHVPGRFEE